MKKLLHPFTMWIVMLTMVATTIIVDNVAFSLGVMGGALLLVLIRSDGSPWNKTFWFSLKFATALLLFRLAIGVLIGVPIPGSVLFTIPRIQLPSWMPGIRIGGAVTVERLSSSMHEGLVIATIIILFGAASSLTSPHKLLRVLPVAIYEIGITLVIATSLFPQIAGSATRIRQAQRLRGIDRPSFASIAIPLLEESLTRTLQLAESMDSRGFGVNRVRSRYRPASWHLVDSVWVAMTLALAAWVVL